MIKLLEKQNLFPIARAQMRLLIESPTSAEEMAKAVAHLVTEIETRESTGGQTRLVRWRGEVGLMDLSFVDR